MSAEAREGRHVAPADGEPGPGPGRTLAAAREAAGLSLGQVAARLHLDARTVEGLEAERYDELPAPTFVRGYLRSYARLVDVEPDPIVAAFDRREMAPPALIADIAERPQAQSTDLPMRAATYLIVAGLVGLVVLWWQSRGPGPIIEPLAGVSAPAPPEGALPPASQGAEAWLKSAEEPGREALATPTDPMATERDAGEAPGTRIEGPAAANASPAPDAVAVAIPDLPAAITIDATAEAAAEPAAGPEEAAERGTTVAALAPAAVGGTEPEDAPAETTADPGTAQAPATGDTEIAAVESTGEVAAGPPAVPAGPGDRIQITPDHESWVEVYDAAGERLFFNLAAAGRELDLRGTSPFRVLLGYARGVRVRFNGVDFDPAPFSSRGIARFHLGGPASPAGPDDLDARAPTPAP